jgi:hypothetical protein
MLNADMPAMPQADTQDGYSCNYYDYSGPGIPTGMTKREMMAMHIMCGMQANADINLSSERMAEESVKAADALLLALENT